MTEEEPPEHIRQLLAEQRERTLQEKQAKNDQARAMMEVEPPEPLNPCPCGRPAILLKDGFRIGSYIVYCESKYDARTPWCEHALFAWGSSDKLQTVRNWNEGEVDHARATN